MSLYHRYRPKTFESFIGNETTIETLKADLEKEDRPHAYLIHGPVGCGKTSLGRVIATTLGAKGFDFKEVDSADFRGIDTIRDIRRHSGINPMEGDSRVWLLDECHKLSNDAQNALLKTLEEAPPHVYYILATTNPENLIATIRSRCSQYQVRPLTEEEMEHLLHKVVRKEKEELEQEVLDQIVQDSLGLPRDALQILDQVLSSPKEKRLEVARRQAEIQSQTIALCRALLAKQGWKKVSSILAGLKEEDAENIRRSVLGYCSAVLLKSDNITAAKIMEQFKESVFYTKFPGIVFAAYSSVQLS